MHQDKKCQVIPKVDQHHYVGGPGSENWCWVTGLIWFIGVPHLGTISGRKAGLKHASGTQPLQLEGLSIDASESNSIFNP